MARGFDMFRFQVVPWPVLLDEVRYLESVGAGTIWIADHYGWPPEPETPILESWTTNGKEGVRRSGAGRGVTGGNSQI